MMCEVDMPMDTAGFKEPPETLPMAKPPTVAHTPIAKPKYSESGGNGEDHKGEDKGEHERCNDDLAPHVGR